MKLSLPAAVLLGLILAGALVAAAIVYTFPRAAAPAPSPTALVAPPVSTPLALEAPGAPDVAAAARAKGQLAAPILALASACWRASDAGGSAQGAVDVTFDAEGKVVTHGVKELLPGVKLPQGPGPGTLPPGHGAVMGCIDAGLGGLRVEAPGARLEVEVPFTLP